MIPSKTAPFLTAPPVAASASAAKLGKPSAWLWVPWVWLFFASTRTLSTWLAWNNPGATRDQDLVGGNPVDRMLMISLILLGLFVLGLRGEQTKRILARNKWVVALFIYMALSVIWSNFPGISLRRCTRSAGTLVMVLVVLTERNPLEAVRALLRRLYLVVIPLSVIAIKYFRNIGVAYNWSGAEEDWIGLTTDKNCLGQVATCSGLFYPWQILQDWPRKKSKRDLKKLMPNMLLLGLTLWLLRGSKNTHSSTAIVGFITCAAVLFALQFIKKRAARAKRIILGVTVACAVLSPFVYLAFETFDITPFQMVVKATGRNMTFTDRTYLWTDILNDAAKSPVLGVGIGAFWVGPVGYDLYPLPNWSLKTPEWRPEEGHNGFIDVYVELGAIGAILLLMIIVFGFAGALTDLENDFQYGSLRLVLLLSIVMNNITETSFLKGTHDLWFLFLLVAVNLPRATNRVTSKEDSITVIEPGNPDERPSKINAWRSLLLFRDIDNSLVPAEATVPGRL